jgi:hypothetical protein
MTHSISFSRLITDSYCLRLILSYLIPCHLVTTHTLPTERLLGPYPRLKALFAPLCRSIRSGDLTGFDAALAAGEDEFVRRRIYLTLERGRDIAIRNLYRRVFIEGDKVDRTLQQKKAEEPRRTRVPVEEFRVAMNLATKSQIPTEEVECLLANMIYKVRRHLGSLDLGINNEGLRRSRLLFFPQVCLTRQRLRLTSFLEPDQGLYFS